MRPSEKFEAKAAGQKCLAAGRRASPGVVCVHVDPVRDPPLEVRRQLLTGDPTEKVSNRVENLFSPTTQPSGFPWG